MTREQWDEFKGYMMGEPGAILFCTGLLMATLLTLAMYWHRTSQPNYKDDHLTPTMKIKGMLANAIFVYFGLRIAGIWVETPQFLFWSMGTGLVSDKIGVYAARSGGIISRLVNKRLDKIERKVDEVQVKQEEVQVKQEEVKQNTEIIINKVAEIKQAQ
jgi:hypothetical protein